MRAIKTVKANRAEERIERPDRGQRQDARRTSAIRAARKEAMAWTIAWTGVQLAIIVILAVGAWRVDEGLLEVSSLIAFLLYAFGLMGPITELTQQITALQSGIAAAARIRDVDALELERGTVPARRDREPRRWPDPRPARRPRRRTTDDEPVIRGVELRDPAPRAHRDRRARPARARRRSSA